MPRFDERSARDAACLLLGGVGVGLILLGRRLRKLENAVLLDWPELPTEQ